MSEQEYYSDRIFLTNTFIGYFTKCQAAAVAYWLNEYTPPTTKAMLIGSYVDSHFSGTLEKFKEDHPEIFLKSGDLKADFKLAEKLIQNIEGDATFKETLEGDTQRIFKGKIHGFRFKCKADSYHQQKNRLTDLKTSRNPTERIWDPGKKEKVSPIERWGYKRQMAIYSELIKQETGKLPQALLSIISKEDTPNKIIVEIPPEEMAVELERLKYTLEELATVISKQKPARRCEHCEYCRRSNETRVLSLEEYEGLTYEE